MAQIVNQRTVEEFKASHNISKLFIHKSTERKTDEQGNTTIVAKRFENGPCKYFACDAAGKNIIAISQAICADLEKSTTFAPNRAVCIRDIVDEKGSTIPCLMYSGKATPIVM